MPSKENLFETAVHLSIQCDRLDRAGRVGPEPIRMQASAALDEAVAAGCSSAQILREADKRWGRMLIDGTADQCDPID